MIEGLVEMLVVFVLAIVTVAALKSAPARLNDHSG